MSDAQEVVNRLQATILDANREHQVVTQALAIDQKNLKLSQRLLLHLEQDSSIQSTYTGLGKMFLQKPKDVVIKDESKRVQTLEKKTLDLGKRRTQLAGEMEKAQASLKSVLHQLGIKTA